jgi:hypothetical protein
MQSMRLINMSGSSIQGNSPFQREEGGSSPSLPLQFSPCRLLDVSKFVKQYHYSHTHPGGIDYCFRLDVLGSLMGAALFGQMAGNPKASCLLKGHENPQDYRELMRLVLLDEVPKNSESQFVGWCLRWLRKNTGVLAVISFADPRYGHTGIIYRAGNWVYCGLQKQDRPRLIIDGSEIHPRMAYDKYGTSSTKMLVEVMGLDVKLEPRTPKHRYVYVLRPELKNLLKDRLFSGTVQRPNGP